MATTRLYAPRPYDSFDPAIAGVAPILASGTDVDNTKLTAVQAAAAAAGLGSLPTSAGGVAPAPVAEPLRFRGAWQANFGYSYGDVVSQGGLLYVAPQSFTSGSSFVAGNWTQLGLADGSTIVSGGSLTVQDENSNVSTSVTQIDFQGAGVTASAGTGEVVVTIPGGSTALTPTAVKTANYTAAAGDLVPVDTTSTSRTVTLPTAPADKSQVGVKHVVRGGTNTVTIACGGSDVFNKTGGSATLTLITLNQGAIVQYKASTGIWYVVSDDLALAQLDARFTTLADYYGTTSGKPNSPQGVALNPPLGPNLFAEATTALGAGYVNAGITSGSLNAGANATLTWRINVGNIFNDSNGNADNCLRFTYDITTTIVSGNSGLYFRWTDNTGTQLGGTSDYVLFTTPSTALTHYKGVFELRIPTGAVNCHIVLQTLSNTPSGTITVNSGDLRRVALTRDPIVVGWTAGTPNTSGGVFTIDQPIGYSTELNLTTTWCQTTLAQDSNLEAALTAAVVQYGAPTFGTQNPLAVGTNHGAISTGNIPGMSLSGTAGNVHINNASHIMCVINGSNVQEFRCNTHGGETGRTGTFSSDFIYEYDVGDGVWNTISPVSGLAHFCKRFRFTQHTKVAMSTSLGSPFANIDYVWTFFDDGTVRQDRTVTFLADTPMWYWFVWMFTIGAGDGRTRRAKVGAGSHVHGSIDLRSYLASPTISGVTTATTGGTLAAATYSYKVTALNAAGESLPSAAGTVTTTGTTSTATVTWGAVTGATAYQVYGRTGTNGYWNLVALVGPGTTSWVDDGSAIPTTPAPTVNTAFDITAATISRAVQSSLAAWCAWYMTDSNTVFATIIDRDQVLATHPSATAIRGEVVQHAGVLTKNYWQLEAANGGNLPKQGTGAATQQDNGTYNVTVPSGTVIPNTSWAFHYVPSDTERFERELADRSVNPAQLTTVYPSA